jgi:predicted metal-dependent hydrolase
MMSQDVLSSPSDWRRHLQVRPSKRARHVRLKVHRNGLVELVVPLRFDTRQLPEILDAHEPWVLRTLKRLGGMAAVPRLAVAPERIHLPAIDGAWQVEYTGPDESRLGCRERGESLLRVSGGLAWQGALKRWLARKGKEHLVPWLDQVSEELQLPYSGVTLRGQKSRWGSCSARHHINLNYALLFLPPHCVRYLFVHELCHTVHLNHSARYWALVASKEPEYRRLENELRQAGSRVPHWLHATEIAAAG